MVYPYCAREESVGEEKTATAPGKAGETIVVVGAGVSGLTTALLLCQDQSNSVTVVAKHMPGDYDIEYASPFAGANFMPMATKEDGSWETRTWPEIKRLAAEVPESGIQFQKCQINRRNKDLGATNPHMPTFDPNPWFSSLFPDFKHLSEAEVAPGSDSSSEYTGVCINTPVYLSYLVGQLLRRGAVLKRAVLSDIHEAKHLSHSGRPATIVVNASGLGSLKLGGVKDENMMPARAQTVLVRNEFPIQRVWSGTDDDPTDVMYMMTRPGGGGTILGGTYDIGNWESQPDPNTANRIMTRLVKAVPELGNGKGVDGVAVVRHAVGLRPYRKGGVRLEAERMDEGTWVVHNYGHAGWGYQGSYGCAEDVVELVGKIRQAKSKL